MGEFYINTQAITGQSGRLVDVGSSIKGIKSKVAGVASGLDSIGLSGMSAVLEAIQTKLMMHVNTADTLSAALSRIVLKYIAAESEIMGIPFYLNPDYITAFLTTAENSVGIIQNEWDALTGFYSGDYCTYGEADEYGFLRSESYWEEDGIYYNRSRGWLYPDSEFSWGASNDLFDEYHQNETYLDDDIHREYQEDFENRRRETLHLIQADAGISVSLYHDGISAEGAYGNASASYDFLKAEANGTIWGGLCDENGNFAPGFGAEIGASVSVFSANAEGLLGSDYLGIYGEAGIDVGKVSAEMGFAAGLVDETGKYNPSLGFEASLEAVAAQVNGSTGVRIMGTDIGVSGSAGFGIGAHADIGIMDGKLSVDVGAYLGVGLSGSFEIDFSETYDTMLSAYDEVTEYFSNNSPSDMWNDFTDTVSDGWNDFTDTVSDGWNDFTDSVSDGWNDFTDTVSDGWNDFTGSVSDGWDSFTEGAGDAWDAATSWWTL